MMFPDMFNFIFVIFMLVFLFAFVTIFVKNISQWNKNNHSPRLTVEARVVTKRTNVSHHTHHNTVGNGMMSSTGSTSYYVTFEFESTDRMELHVQPYDYGMLVEGDKGKLTIQGTRFISFERE